MSRRLWSRLRGVHMERTVCAECMYPVTFDEVFGWLHDDYGPDGRSFDHRAMPLIDKEN